MLRLKKITLCQGNSMWGKEQPFQQMVLGQMDMHMRKNEVRPLFNTTHKN